MKVLCVLTKHNYGVPTRGVSIEYAAFLPALRSLGHETRHLESWDSILYPTYEDLNEAILRAVEEWQPDVVFTVQRDYEIWLETLQAIADRGDTALVTWTTDDSFKFQNCSRFIGPFYDAIATTYDYRVGDYRKAGIKSVVLTQWAANEEWLRPPIPARECLYGVSFIGTKYGKREEITSRLEAAGIVVHCFGFGWASGPVETEDIPRIMRDSIVSLNFCEAFRVVEGRAVQLKARTFEIPGAGGFLLSDRVPGIEEFYRIGTEIDVFDSQVDLESKIKFYLAHPDIRDRLAAAGFERTRSEHVYSIRLAAVLDFALQQLRARQPAMSLSDRGEATRPIFVHRPLSFPERLYTTFLTRACRMIWGHDRGIKAARRFTFEASVRLRGARTFTSRSLPARLFPYV